MICVICKKDISSPIGHNADPVASGRCCDFCNVTVVLPARMKIMIPKLKAKKQ
jgi:hypothetical protein